MSGSAERFAVLGPVRAWYGVEEVNLGSPQQRVTTAVLLLRRSYPVPTGELLEAVWGERPPRSAVNQLHIHVHKLRRAMERAGGRSPLIESVPGGYRLPLPSGAVDVEVFQEKVARALRTRPSEAGQAIVLLREALALWQGDALADLPGNWARAQRVRLDQLRLEARENLFRRCLENGSHRDVVAEAPDVIARYPLDERFREIHMLALYRAGQRAAALAAYTDARKLLSAELGVGPGPALRTLHERILRGDTGLLAPEPVEHTGTGTAEPSPTTPSPHSSPAPHPARVPAPAQLPHDLPVFSGRHQELDELIQSARTGRRQGAGAVVCVVAGAAGVGKTTLAVHAAHRLAEDYPDGQLHLDLHGFDAHESPISPRRALRLVLEAFGVSGDRLPEDATARAALYRGLLADRRVLLLLDNARDARQIRPLLPPSPGSLVLTTSRDQLTALVVRDGAHHLRLEALAPAAAHALLTRRLGAARVDADPAATRLVIERSAGLPLALALVAARATTCRVPSLTVLADELRAADATLDALGDADSTLDVRSVFSWSYDALSHEAARLYRLTALAPGTGCSHTALAALAGLPRTHVRPLVHELTAAHLMDEPDPGRFVSHDLLREYAAGQLAAHEDADARTAAFRRLLAHYLRTAHAAARVLSVHLPPLAPHPEAIDAPAEDIPDLERALTWFAREDDALTHLVERAGATPGCETQTWQLVWALTEHLQREGRWDDRIAAQHTALRAAERGADRLGQAHSRRNLARAYGQAGRYDEAQTHLTAAIGLFGVLGDSDGQARCLNNLAAVLTLRGEHAAAVPHAERAVALSEAAGDLRGLGPALNNLGWIHAQNGAFEESLDCCRRALDALRSVGDRAAEAGTLDTLGYVHHRLGEHEQALACYRRALEIDRELDDSFNEADTLSHVGETRFAMGDPDGARKAWEASLDIFEERDPHAAERVATLLKSLGGPEPR
ncbi:tetratricopeptide repeat protein [Streptomyces sp. LP11]|uniref:Tetratricopeptide repeat protein n=1 Tax=Streptomyces pyxinicus TaxID=2970331 RepID=A0ABT2B7D3_9ACTN|nr:BTAD domain-containing putative transcriptional regulator [Streptomyces sp. LP11]MCS0604416.1 tetratricopeptide repeat protein [Streptomyces sp. LP11]